MAPAQHAAPFAPAGVPMSGAPALAVNSVDGSSPALTDATSAALAAARQHNAGIAQLGIGTCPPTDMVAGVTATSIRKRCKY